MATAIFPDTMVLIHYQPKKLPWAQLAGDTSVEVKVVPRVTSEIDEHKERAHSGVLRRRAITAQQLLLECDGKEMSPGVPLELIPFDAPGPLPDARLDPNVPDDRILASILRYKADNPQQRVVLFTADAGPQSKAKHLGLACKFIGTEHRLKHEDDPEVIELKRTVAALEKRVDPEPILSVSFEDGEAHRALSVRLFRYSEAWLEDQFKMAEEHMNGPAMEAKRVASIFSATHLPATKADEQQYLKKMREYLEAYGRHRDVACRTFKVSLKLTNTGSAPAEEVEINFQTPKHVSLLARDNLPFVPEPPELKGRSLLESLLGIEHPQPPPFDLHALLNHTAVPKFSEGAECWTASSVRHHTSEEVTFFVRLKDFSNLKGFAIGYTILADNMVQPKRGELSFNLQLSPFRRQLIEKNLDAEPSGST